MSNSVRFIPGRKKTRGELRLPQLHFIMLDDWQHKIGKEAIWAWLEFYSWADRSESNRDADVIPTSMNKIQKKLGVGKDTFYNKIIRPLWNHGFIDLQEIELETTSGHNPVNIIVYEYPNNDPDCMTKTLEKIRDYDTEYITETRKSAKKGGRPKKVQLDTTVSELPSSHTELPSSHTELPNLVLIQNYPLVPTENYPSSHTEPNNVLNQSNVLNDYNETDISQSVSTKIESEAIQAIISQNKRLQDRLTDIEHVYSVVKNEKGYSDALFISTLEKASLASIRVPFRTYLLRAMINNLNELKVDNPQKKKKTDLPSYVAKQLVEVNLENEVGFSTDQKKEVLDLLLQLGEITETEYIEKMEEIIAIPS